MSWSRSRRIVQLVMLAAFVGLTIGGLQAGGGWLLSGLFSRADPLLGLSAVIAGRALTVFWAAALLTVVLTIVFGRAWCGWICPLGTTLELAALPEKLRGRVARGWRYGKFVTLAVALGAAVFGTLGPMLLDPVTIITRPFQELARPWMGNDAVGQSVGATLGRQGMHAVAFLSLIPLAAVIALNLVERRFWCRSLCPLGGLLALIAKVPGMRRLVDAETCTSCARCAKACPTGAVDRSAGFASSSSECIVCMSCVEDCKTGANRFGFSDPGLPAHRFDPTRRDALVAFGATGLGLAGAFLPFANSADAEILRPPSTTEERLASLCVRCGACYGACPTGSLRPSVSFTTPAGPWTPMLDERPAHCTLNCNRCAVPCPTDAIHTPTADEAADLGLGVKAEVNRERCRAWSRNRECMKCQSVCPIAGALVGQSRPVNLPIKRSMGRPDDSTSAPVQVPVVNTDLCVGCNQCATVCVMTPAAIGSPLPEQPPADMPIQMPPVGMPGGAPQGMPGGTPPSGMPGTY